MYHIAPEDQNLPFMLRRDEQKKKFYKPCDCEAATEKQQFNPARTIVPPPIIQEEMG